MTFGGRELIVLAVITTLVTSSPLGAQSPHGQAPAAARRFVVPAEKITAPPGRPKARSDSATVMWAVRTLASPEMEGRGPGTAGSDRAAEFIAAEMRFLGLAPGGDDETYFQKFELTTGVEVGTPTAIEAGGNRHDAGDHMQPLGFSSNGTLKAPVVFAGYGITAPGFEYDDYAGLDVRDKLVLVFSNEPGEMDSTSRFDGSVNTPHAELRTKAINAREHGALGLLVVDGPLHHAGEPLRRPRRDSGGYMTSGLLAAQVSAEVAAALLRGTGQDLASLQAAIDRETKPRSVALQESAAITVTLKRTRATIRNVVGVIPGRDTSRAIVVGAHYDHLGYGGETSLTPDARVPHLGADDNASGTAAMLAVAAAWGRTPSRSGAAAPRRPAHTLVFCAFAGEETGLVGSSHFIDASPVPVSSIEAMLNMDMVGRLRENRLMVMGVGTAAEFAGLVERANEKGPRFTVRTSGDGYGPSDHSSFYKRQVPVLALFTGAHPDYHKPSDSADKINAAGLWQIARFATALVESLDARPVLTFQRAKADSSTMGRIAGGGGYGAYLGTIPDYMQTEGGVLLSGVRTGSPADSAGLKANDVIVKFDGVRVDNIYDYTYALRSRKPGQQVRITVKRENQELELLATLGRRR
jgi:hypothetical protein